MATTRHLLSDEQDHRREVIEDVIWLTDCGEAPANIARRLGYASADNLARLMYRWGEPSLARRLTAEREGVAA